MSVDINKDGFCFYRFMIAGVPYFKTLETRDKREALRIEKKAKDIAKDLSKVDDAKELIHRYKKVLSKATKLKIEDSFDSFVKKPRKKLLSEPGRKAKLSFWNDFLDFMAGEYPEVKYLAEVEKGHAEEWIQYLRMNGRYNSEICYTREGVKVINSKAHRKKLAINTLNKHHSAAQEIYGKLMDDIGVTGNVFAKIDKLTMKKSKIVKHVPFDDAEIKDLLFCDDRVVQKVVFTGLFTAFRRIDICLFLKSDIDWKKNIITRLQSKTEGDAHPPILPPFRKYLELQFTKFPQSKYVDPELAEIYLDDPKKINRRINAAMDDLGIVHQKKFVGGKTRSIKGLHSLRYNYIIESLKVQMPLATLTKIVGHAAIEMTLHYQSQVKPEDCHRWTSQMSFAGSVGGTELMGFWE
jgi:integrase